MHIYIDAYNTMGNSGFEILGIVVLDGKIETNYDFTELDNKEPS